MRQRIYIWNGLAFSSPSRLLIPDFLLEEYNLRVKQFGSLGKLFHFVVNNRHRLFSQKSFSERGRVTYQPSSGIFHKKDFFPSCDDWGKFRFLALSRRVSMTFLFVLLLLDWEGFEMGKTGVPTKPSSITLLQTLTIRQIYTFLEIEHILL